MTNLKRIDSSQHGFWERFLVNIPFVFIVAFIIAFLGASAFVGFYSIVTAIAFKSAMVYMIFAGACALCLGAGLGCIHLFKVYYKFYERKMGLAPAVQKDLKTKTYDKKKSIKDYLTLINVSIAILLLGAIFTIISAALGCINRDNWVEAKADFMQRCGYYADVDYREFRYSSDGISGDSQSINKIDFSLASQNAVIIYNNDANKNGFIVIQSFFKFENQLSIAVSKSGTITITENDRPVREGTLEKLLFFLFTDNKAEKQIRVYIPESLQARIQISGNNIIYAIQNEA